MLQALLNDTETGARRVVDIASAIDHREAADHARNVVDHVVPLGRQQRDRVLAFVDGARTRIEAATKRNSAESAREDYHAIANDLMPLATAVSEFQREAASARASVEADLAAINKEIADLGVRVAARTREATEAQEKAKNRADRSFWTWFGGPLVKAIDELISVIQDGTSTEEGAKRALKALQDARDDISRYENSRNTLQALANGANGLANGAQSLVNVIAMVGAHASNAADDLKDAAQFEIFRHAALMDLQELHDVAA